MASQPICTLWLHQRLAHLNNSTLVIICEESDAGADAATAAAAVCCFPLVPSVAGALMTYDDEGFVTLDTAPDGRRGAKNVLSFAQVGVLK